MERFTLSTAHTLAEHLDADASVALVFLPLQMDAGTIVALRQARKWCDFLCVAGLPASQKLIPAPIGVDAFVDLSSDQLPQTFLPPMGVSAALPVDGSFLLQTLLGVMPSLVVAPVAAGDLFAQIWRLAASFPDLFVFKPVAVPDEMVTQTQLLCRDFVKDAVVQEPSLRAENLRTRLSAVVVQQKYKLKEISFFCEKEGAWQAQGVLPKHPLLRIVLEDSLVDAFYA